MVDREQPERRGRRRRAVGPAGAAPSCEPDLGLVEPPPSPGGRDDGDDDERLLREVPPHHG